MHARPAICGVPEARLRKPFARPGCWWWIDTWLARHELNAQTFRDGLGVVVWDMEQRSRRRGKLDLFLPLAVFVAVGIYVVGVAVWLITNGPLP